MPANGDTNALLHLKDTLDVAQKNTSRMITKLQRFEDRLNLIDQKMRPLQTTTDNYWTAKENIAKTLQEIEKTYEYIRIADDMRVVVSTGLNYQNHKEFFEALGKLTLAKKFFESHREIKASGENLIKIDSLLKV